jgi:hypothetical protein
MDVLKRYANLETQARQAQTEADQAQGGLNNIKSRLSKEYDCKTLKAAKDKLDRLKEEAEEKKQELETDMDEFKEKWNKE